MFYAMEEWTVKQLVLNKNYLNVICFKAIWMSLYKLFFINHVYISE